MAEVRRAIDARPPPRSHHGGRPAALLALDARVQSHAKVVPCAVTREKREHFKRDRGRGIRRRPLHLLKSSIWHKVSKHKVGGNSPFPLTMCLAVCPPLTRPLSLPGRSCGPGQQHQGRGEDCITFASHICIARILPMPYTRGGGWVAGIQTRRQGNNIK